MYNLLIHSIVDGHLGSFQSGDISYSTAVLVYVFSYLFMVLNKESLMLDVTLTNIFM